MNRCVIVIPARLASTRFPNKPLVDLCGKPMIQWVYEAAMTANVASEIIVASPDDEILKAASAFNAKGMRTGFQHQSGTDRAAEVARQIEADVIVNVQGDEPLIDPENIRRCAHAVSENVQVATLWTACSEAESEDHSVVKVVLDIFGNAIYFSRFPIPYARSAAARTLRKHVGIYGYKRSALSGFSGWSQSDLERSEGLEQLRFLERGVPIKVVEGRAASIAVDTPEQADQVRHLLQRRLDGVE